MPRNNPEGVPNVPLLSLQRHCRTLAKALVKPSTKLPIQLGSASCMVEPCAQEGLFGLMKQERPRDSLESLHLTRPGLWHRQCMGLESFGPGSRADLGVRIPGGGARAQGASFAGAALCVPCSLGSGRGVRSRALVLGYVLGRRQARLASL